MVVRIEGAGSITGLLAGGLPDGSITSAELANGAVTAAKIGYAGAILQIQEFTLTTLPSTSSVDTFVDITGWSDTITPISSSSKVLININIGRLGKSDNSIWTCPFRLMRSIGGGAYSAIGVPATAGSRMLGTFVMTNQYGDYAAGSSFSYLDSPSTTSEITYKLQWTGQNGETWYINRAGVDSDNADALYVRTQSYMYLLEVAA